MPYVIALYTGELVKWRRGKYFVARFVMEFHKERNRENNNLNNLELICPNCHYEEHLLEKSWLKEIVEK